MNTTPQFKIDSNLPIPTRCGRGRRLLYPFDQLKNGQSFFVPNAKRSMAACAYLYGKRHKRTFVTSRVTEDGVQGLRIWRKA